MTLPEQMRARADREERIYAVPELAKMLRAGADAIEERDRLRDTIRKYIRTVGDAEGVDFIEPGTHLTEEDCKALLALEPRPSAEDYEWNERYDAAWPPEVTK